jgi:hypothetical protein
MIHSFNCESESLQLWSLNLELHFVCVSFAFLLSVLCVYLFCFRTYALTLCVLVSLVFIHHLLLSSGKVCLSLLGTWSGAKGESWSAQNSTFLQVAISIQALIFVAQPYFNEPGYESYINTSHGRMQSQAYNDDIQQATIRHAMISQMNSPPEPFKDIVKTHFALHKKRIMNQCEEWAKTNAKVKALLPQLQESLNKQKLT